MTAAAASRQQLDPAGTLGAYVPTVILVGVAFAWGLVATLVTGAGSPVLSALALVVLGVAGTLAVHAATSRRAPTTMLEHLGVHFLVLLAGAMSTWANWQSGPPDRIGWVPFSLGIIMIALAPYRPVRELVAVGATSAVVIGFVTFLGADSAPAPGRPIVTAIAAGVVALAFCFGSAAYSREVIETVRRGRRRSDEASDSRAGEVRDGIVRSVQFDRVTILNRDVVPFFTDVLGRRRITNDDRERARAISAAIRGIMVADADRSWLEGVVQQVGESGGVLGVVDDPDHLAAELHRPQRTALRAFIFALADDPRAARPLSVALSLDGRRCAGVLSIDIDEPAHIVRARYGRSLAVLRSAFPSFAVHTHRPRLIVRFHYERR